MSNTRKYLLGITICILIGCFIGIMTQIGKISNARQNNPAATQNNNYSDVLFSLDDCIEMFADVEKPEEVTVYPVKYPALTLENFLRNAKSQTDIQRSVPYIKITDVNKEHKAIYIEYTNK